MFVVMQLLVKILKEKENFTDNRGLIFIQILPLSQVKQSIKNGTSKLSYELLNN